MRCGSLKFLVGFSILLPSALCSFSSTNSEPHWYFQCIQNLSITLKDRHVDLSGELQKSKKLYWDIVESLKYSPYHPSYQGAQKEELKDNITKIASKARCGPLSEEVFGIYEFFLYLADYMQNKSSGFYLSYELFQESVTPQQQLRETETRAGYMHRLVPYKNDSVFLGGIEAQKLPFKIIANHLKMFLMVSRHTFVADEHSLYSHGEQLFMKMHGLEHLHKARVANPKYDLKEAVYQDALDEGVSDEVDMVPETSLQPAATHSDSPWLLPAYRGGLVGPPLSYHMEGFSSSNPSADHKRAHTKLDGSGETSTKSSWFSRVWKKKNAATQALPQSASEDPDSKKTESEQKAHRPVKPTRLPGAFVEGLSEFHILRELLCALTTSNTGHTILHLHKAILTS